MRSKLQSVVLNDLCEQIVDSEHKTAPTQSFGIPYVRTPNVKNTRLILDESLRVDEATYKEWTKRIEPKPYDIILCREAPVGDSAMILDNQKVCLGQRTVLIRSNKEKIYPKYLLFLLNSPKVKHELLSNSGGTHVDHLNMKDIRNLKVQIHHSYDEQKIIGNFLFDLNSQIHSIENQNKILEQMAQAIFKSWFVDFDGVTEFEDSELGKIPKGWEIVKLCEISKVIDSAHITPKYSSNGLSMVRVTNIQNGFLNLEGTLKVTRNVYEEFTKNYKPQKNDILMSRVGTYGIVCFVGTDEPFCLGQNTVVIHSILNYFIYHNLISKLTQNQIETKVDGSTQKTITLKNIRNLLIVKPNEKDEGIIKKFNEKISTIFENMINNNYQIHVLTKTRDALLPKLMSGEIRV